MNQKRKIIFATIPFFLIFSVFVFLLPSSFVNAGCDVLNGFDGCGTSIIVWISDILRALATTFFWISAMVFDNLLHIGLSTDLLNQPFIKVAWSNIKDLANVGFILGIIYIAFSMLFDYANWQKSLVYLVIIIFTINFSLFFARVIVDAGNITANVFLSAVAIDLEANEDYFFFAKKVNHDENTKVYKSVGAALVNGLKPENLLGENNFQSWQAHDSKERKIGGYLAMNLILVIVYIMLGKKFLFAGFMFLGRLVWIVYYMISAPIWFITLFIPGQENLLKKKWLFPLLSKSFCIVVYLFFIWLIYIILSSGISDIGNNKGSGDFWGVMAVFAIKGIFIFILLDKAEKIGSSMCEDGDSTFDKIAGGVGAIAGKVPFVGGMARTLTGGLGKKLISKVGNLRASKSMIGRFAGDKMALFGRGMQDIKVGKKSYRDDQNARTKKLAELDRELSPDLQEQRTRNRLKVGGKDRLDYSKIDSFVDPKMNMDFEKYKHIIEDMKKGKRSASIEEVEFLNKFDKDANTKNAIFKENVVAGNIMSALIPHFAATKNRFSEDRETKISKQDKEIEKEKTRNSIVKRAEEGEIFDNNLNNPTKNKQAILDFAKNSGSGDIIDQLRKQIEILTPFDIIKKEEERWEKMKQFEKEDYKYGNDPKFEKEALESLNNSDEPGSDRMKKQLEDMMMNSSLSAGTSMSDELKSMISKVVKPDESKIKEYEEAKKDYQNIVEKIKVRTKAYNKYQDSIENSRVRTMDSKQANKSSTQRQGGDVSTKSVEGV